MVYRFGKNMDLNALSYISQEYQARKHVCQSSIENSPIECENEEIKTVYFLKRT